MVIQMRNRAFIFLVVSLLIGPQAAGADWPEWRGPGREGRWVDVLLPSKLSPETIEKIWSAQIGAGYSGISVAEGRVLTMDRPGKSSRERIICLDRKTGNLVWTHEQEVDYGDMDYANGPRCTPTIHAGRVYTQGALGHVHVLELESGKPLWNFDVHRELGGKLPEWGHAPSPLVADGLVHVQGGGPPGPTLLALDAATGKERWRALTDKLGYSSLVLAKVRGSSQLVHWSAENIAGLDPRTGRVLWKSPYKSTNDVAIISPVIKDEILFVSGYWEGSRAVRLDGQGEPETVWSGKGLSCLMSTPLLREGHLYALDKDSGLECVEWRTGKVLWSDGHKTTPRERNPQASMVWAGERAVMLNARGELILASLTPAGCEEQGRVKVCGDTWSHPAFSGNDIFVRAETELACWRIKGPSRRKASQIQSDVRALQPASRVSLPPGLTRKGQPMPSS